MASLTSLRRVRVGSMEVLIFGLFVFMLLSSPLRSAVARNPKWANAGTVFCGVFVQAVPFLVLGVLISGLIAAFVSAERLNRWLPKRAAVAVLAAGVAVRRCRAANAARYRWRADSSATAAQPGRPR